jgi:hypothetical protein
LKINKKFDFQTTTYEHHQYLSMHRISGNKSQMGSIEVPIDREYLDQATGYVSPDSHLFLRTWLAFKVRKCQKEALKAPDR